MERLNFIEPPVSVEKYNPKGLFSRKRLHGNLSEHEWILILADRKTLIRWTIPWWNIRGLADTHSSPYIRIASLSVLTFYFPVRVRRQYGQRQFIPETDTLKPLDKPMLRGNAHSWEDYWKARPRNEITTLASGNAKVSKHYLAWIAATTALGRAEARRAERGSYVSDSSDIPASKSRAVSVKDRLGPKKMPVWGRLETLPPLTIGSRKASQKPADIGKGKAIVEDKGKGKKVLKRARTGESSKAKEIEESSRSKGKEKMD